MKQLLEYGIILLIFTSILFMSSCTSKQIQSSKSNSSSDSISTWFSGHQWLNGLNLKPHPSIDEQKFAKQYHAHKQWWDAAFNFLKTHDLQTLEAGRYEIDGDNVYASVVVGVPKNLDQVKWESHRHYNDLQYIAKGEALMGMAPLSTAKVTEAYNNEKDIAHYQVKYGKYYVAKPGTFFIFQSTNVHRAGIRIAGNDSSVTRIIIKVRTGK